MCGTLPPLSHGSSFLPNGVPPFSTPLPPIFDSLLAITPSHGELEVVIVRVVSTVRGGLEPCTLPPAVRLLSLA